MATTTVTRFELYYGAYKSRDVRRNLTALKGVFSSLRVFTLTDGAAEQAAKLLAQLEAKGKPLVSRDLFVGAISLEEGYAVATDNVDHFDRIPSLQVVHAKRLLNELAQMSSQRR